MKLTLNGTKAGAISGAVAGGISWGVNASGIPKTFDGYSKYVGSGLTGGVNSKLNGGSFQDGFIMGAALSVGIDGLVAGYDATFGINTNQATTFDAIKSYHKEELYGIPKSSPFVTRVDNQITWDLTMNNASLIYGGLDD
jgi:hypothetical protein